MRFEGEILSRYRDLAEEGAAAYLQYLQQRNTVEETNGTLRQTQLDGLRQKALLEQDIQRLKSDISTRDQNCLNHR